MIFGLIILVVIILFVVFIIAAYNGLVRLKNKVDEAWAQIDVQLRRRYDLIPNLVETVKGYASHEKETLEKVIAARNAGVAAQGQGAAAEAQADNALTSTLKSLFAVAEAYPDLKANQNFLALQEELTATEDKVAYARQYYNDSVNRFNTKIQTFPSVVIAGALHYTAREYFQAEGDARGPVQVQF